jgi:hypothetical protein
MTTYTFSEEAFKKIKKQSIIRYLFFILLMIPFVFIILEINKKPDTPELGGTFIFLPLFFVTIALLMGLIKGQKKLKLNIHTFSISLSNNLITRKQNNVQPLSLYFTEIKEIIESSTFLKIVGIDKKNIIHINKLISNYDDLREKLNKISTIKQSKIPKIIQKYPLLIWPLIMGALYCVFAITVKNKLLVAFCGLSLATLFIYSFKEMQTSKSIDVKSKRISWFILVFTISIIGATIAKLLDAYKH